MRGTAHGPHTREESDRTFGAVSADESPRRWELVGDEADLFREFNPRLVRILRGKTNASRETIDDVTESA